MKQLIARKLYKLFYTEINKIIHSNQGKPPDFTKLQYSFVDSNGKKYYRYPDDFDIPIKRKGKLEELIIELSSCISKRELRFLLGEFKKAYNKDDRALMGYLLTEMENREQMLIHHEIMFELATVVYIREDENPAEIDEELHKEKYKQFELDSQGGLYDFFYQAGLSTYIPFLSKLKKDWSTYFATSRKEVKVLEKLLKNYSSEKKSSKKDLVTEKK